MVKLEHFDPLSADHQKFISVIMSPQRCLGTSKCHLSRLSFFIFKTFTERLRNSTILSKNESYPDQLGKFLAVTDGTKDLLWLLCYRASLHGWEAGTFHRRCDKKNHTVTIIENASYVFGGYTDIPWGNIIACFLILYISSVGVFRS